MPLAKNRNETNRKSRLWPDCILIWKKKPEEDCFGYVY